MNIKRQILMRYGVGLPLFLIGALTASVSRPAAFTAFLLLMILEAVLCFRERGTVLDLRILLTVSWLGAAMLAVLALSALHTEWTAMTFAAVGGFYFFVLFGYDAYMLRKKRQETDADREKPGTARTEPRRILEATVIVFTLGMLSFLAECLRFDFDLPIFSDKAHAYTDFHITGIHYFVVSLMLVPTLTVMYLKAGNPAKKRLIPILLMNLLCFLVPVVMLSKFQLMITVCMPLLMWLLLEKRIPGRRLFLGAAAALLFVAAAFVFLISHRQYPAGYLDRVFRFKDPSTPMLVQYPYIYVVNNLENLNLLVRYSEGLTFGRRCLYPFCALTGLKFLPSVSSFLSVPVYLSREELTTLSIIYDVYGDFGLPGVLIFGFLLGLLQAYVTDNVSEKKTVLGCLLFCELAFYMTLSFFTTWFSNPTTVFWFAATGAIALWCTGHKGAARFSIAHIGDDIYGT